MPRERQQATDKKTYMRCIELGNALGSEVVEVQGKEYPFSWYKVIASTNLYNDQSFRILPDAHRAIASQMNNGVQVYYNHLKRYDRPLGMTRNARVYGKKVQGELGIQEGLNDVNSNDIISRIDTGILSQTSAAFLGGRMISDLTGNEMKRWFLGYYDPETDHNLGFTVKWKNKDTKVTASLDDKRKDLDMIELSIVDRSADPGADVIQKLKSELEGVELSEQYLRTLCNFNNYGYDTICNELGFNSNTPAPRRKSVFTGAQLRKRSGKMATNDEQNTDLENTDDENLLNQSLEDTLKEVDRLNAEVETLQTELDGLPTAEEYDAVLTENAELELKLKEATESEDIENLKKLAAIGEESLEIARYSALTAFAGYHGFEKNSAEWKLEESKLRRKTNLKEITDSATTYRKLSRDGRAGGRDSIGVVMPDKKPAIRGVNNL